MTLGTHSFSEVGFSDGGGVIILMPAINVTIAGYIPTVIPQVSVTATKNVAVTSHTPQIIATVFGDTLAPVAWSESAFSEGAFSEGGLTGAATIVPDTAKNIAVATAEPRIAAGKRVDVPAIAVAVSKDTPHISISATVNSPGTVTGPNIAVQTHVPTLEFITYVGTKNIVIQTHEPLITAGKRVDAPVINLAIADHEPRIAAGKDVRPAIAGDIIVQTHAPRIAVGIKVNAWNVIEDAGSTGTFSSDAFSEAPFSAGESYTRTFTSTHGFRIEAHKPFITAGKRVNVPEASIIAAVHAPELSARPRRVKVQFIAH